MHSQWWVPVLAGAALLPTVADAAVLYSNDFESGVIGPEWSGIPHLTQATNFSQFMGRFSDNTPSTGDHITLTIPRGGDDTHHSGGPHLLTFDLYIIDSWEGDGGGPDRMQVVIGGETLFDYTFSNTNGTQNYPYAPTVGPAQLGFHSTVWDRDSIYRNVQIPFDPGTASEIVITWRGVGLQDVNDESWGIDNINVSSVPAPGAVVLAAVGGLIAARRKRR